MPKLHSTIFRTSDDTLSKFLTQNYDFNIKDNLISQSRDADLATSIELDILPGSCSLKSNATYWKIGVLMPDVKKHATRLSSTGIRVSQPAQFEDIGYLCHTTDSDGNTIELLQHDFEANFRGGFDSNPITLGQVTIRTNKIEASLDFYLKRLGMKILSIQPVEKYSFCLYYLGYTDDNPPSDDLKSIDNREWLWKKPYCTIEIQAVTKRQIEDYEDLKPGEKGWMGLRIKTNIAEAENLFKLTNSTVLRDPNNIPVHIDIE